MDAGAARLDLRLVPAALTGWAVTAAGILWQVTGLVVTLAVAVVATSAAGWWCRGRGEDSGQARDRCGCARGRRGRRGIRDLGGTTRRRAAAASDHPAVRHGRHRRCHTGREPARAGRQPDDVSRGAEASSTDDEMTGRVVVFASAADFSELSAGRPVGFRARVGRPTRQDLTVAVLSATGEPTWGEAATVYRAAHEIRGRIRRCGTRCAAGRPGGDAARVGARRHVGAVASRRLRSSEHRG